MLFPIARAYAPMCQIKFPKKRHDSQSSTLCAFFLSIEYPMCVFVAASRPVGCCMRGLLDLKLCKPASPLNASSFG
jgi:hypothetical protein